MWFWLMGAEADRHWPGIKAAVLSVLDDPRLDDERFDTARGRRREAAELVAILDEAFARCTRTEWAEIFAEHDVWWTPVNTAADLIDDLQAQAAGVFVDVAGAGEARSVATPVTFEHGGWSWARVARMLRAAGHDVVVPTMTGSGERAHLLRADVGLATHVEDLVAVVDAEELGDAVLVAHSYGGLPATGLLDRRGERFREVVYLDAMIGRDGAAVLDGLDPDVVAEKLAGASTINGVRVLPPLALADYGVFEPDDVAWVSRRVTMQPALTYTEPLALDHPTGNGVPCRYVRCVDPRLPTFDQHEARARELGWPVASLATGHDAPVTEPGAVVRCLDYSPPCCPISVVSIVAICS